MQATPRKAVEHLIDGRYGGIDITTCVGQQIVLAARPKGKPELTDRDSDTSGRIASARGAIALPRPCMRARMNVGESYAPPLQIGGIDVVAGRASATIAGVLSKSGTLVVYALDERRAGHCGPVVTFTVDGAL